MKPIIGIIGSRGKMGRVMSELLKSRDIEVLESDIGTPLTNEELINKADITIFSVPISNTVKLIESLAPLAKPGSLLTDLTSIKAPALRAMDKNAPASCEILGLHPMFGPGSILNMSKQVIIVCPVRKGPLTDFILNFFREEGAILNESTAEEHDKIMSVIQGFMHISAIATAITLQKLGFNLDKSLQFASPIYRLRLDMVGRILSQSPELYAEIAIENPLNIQTLRAYQDSISLLGKYLETHDEAGFVDSFKEAADFLGAFKEEAYRRTSELIERSKDIT